MTLILYFTTIVSGIIFKKSKFVTMLIISFMIVFAAFRTDSSDFLSYKIEYESINSIEKLGSARYLGFGFVYFVSNFILQLSFEHYLILFYSVVYLLLFLAIKKCTKSVNLVLALYMIYPYAVDAIQMKHLLAEIFVILGFSFLYDNCICRNNNWLYKFFEIGLIIFCFLLGSLLHSSHMFFGLVIFIAWVCGKIKNRLFAYFIISSLFYILLRLNVLTSFVKILNIFSILNDYDYVKKAVTLKVGFGIFIPLFLIFIYNLFLVYLYQKMIYIKIYCYKILQLLNTSILLMPFFAVSLHYFRLLRVYCLFTFVLIAIYTDNRYTTRGQVLSIMPLVILLLILVKIEILEVYNGTLGAIIQNNSLIPFL